MAKKRTGDPWMPAPKYAATLRGLGVNLLVTSIPASVSFAETVFSAQCVYSDPDFAVLRLGDMEWMLHADHTYDKHPLAGFVANIDGRGAGAESRLHCVNPGTAEARARDGGYTVLAGALYKPHGAKPISSTPTAIAGYKTSRSSGTLFTQG